MLANTATAVFLSSVPLISQALEFVTHATAASWYFTIPVPIFPSPSEQRTHTEKQKPCWRMQGHFGAGYVPQEFVSTKNAIQTLHGWLFHNWENILRSSTWEQSILQLCQQCSSRDQIRFEQKHCFFSSLSWNQLETIVTFVFCTESCCFFYQLKTTCSKLVRKTSYCTDPNASFAVLF